MPVSTGSVTLSSAYAARSNASADKIWVIAINRDYSANHDAVVSITNLSGGQEISLIRAFRFDTTYSAPTSVAAPSFTATGFTDTLPFRSATLYEITLAQPFLTFTPTETGTSTDTPTITPTDTPTPTGTLPSHTPTKTPTPSRTPTPTFTITLTPTETPPGCPVMFNACESLAENGTWSGANATQTLSTTNVTQGSYSLQVNITGSPSASYPTGYLMYTDTLNLSGFNPSVWTGVGQLIMDVYVSPSLIAAGNNRFYLTADSDTAGSTNNFIGVSALLAAGANSVTFQINYSFFSWNNLAVTDHLSMLHFNYYNAATVTGSFYVDNIRLDRSPCAWTPTPTICTDGLGRTCTPTFTPTVTDTPTNTPTPSSVNILFPNPVKDDAMPGFYYEVQGPVNQVKVKVFTVAFRKVYEDAELISETGQHFYTFNRDKINALSNGFYYVALYRRTGGKETREIMKLLIRR